MLTEDQRESNSNPSPSAGQSKQGLTAIEAGAPTTIKGWVISEAEQKLLDEYAACFAEPTDAERLAELLDKVAALLIKKQPIAAGYEVHKIAAALRVKDKQP